MMPFWYQPLAEVSHRRPTDEILERGPAASRDKQEPERDFGGRQLGCFGGSRP